MEFVHLIKGEPFQKFVKEAELEFGDFMLEREKKVACLEMPPSSRRGKGGKEPRIRAGLVIAEVSGGRAEATDSATVPEPLYDTQEMPPLDVEEEEDETVGRQ
jgi:hypothetical protein